MAESAFEKFPAGFRPLIEKLPPPDEHGITVLEGSWWRRERDDIAVLIAKLGRRLQSTERGLKNCREAHATRGGVVRALLEMQEALLEIYGADALWPLTVAIEVFEHAGANKRHWLTALRGDVLHVRQEAPGRVARQACAAATLEYFSGRLGQPQKAVAARIAKAMGAGGFRVSRNEQLAPPAPRTIQDWRNKYQPGKRKGRKAVNPKARGIYVDVLEQLKRAGESRDPAGYFEDWLSDFTDYCRAAAEIRGG